MDIRRLTATLSVAPQVQAEDMAELAALGFKTVICNRPDGEDAGQPSADAVRDAALAAGLAYHHQPVISGGVTEDDGVAFGELMSQVEKPVLAYCRTGTRCTALWAISQAESQPAQDILDTALEAGYQLEGLRPLLQRRAGR
ncbi:TIGR01244 family phosphatase [Stappia sp. F7233]|uniref:TIGR01244 family phosphatase n=1 Tax=Stappia albiluteola TaxID=2758565 RepID=A0A839AG93_9HYPH|nr:TIGR01244 family sulfur transferase [Stappia albiluteola]MBA5778880.1 TIGR01244 family phosphatase [Stappia albiluteola]